MDIRKTAILLLLLVTGIFASNSAEPSVKPVKWRTIIKTTGPDSGTVTFKAIIAPGWHLYALTLPEGGPKPTSFDLSESKGIKLGSAVTPSRKAIETDDPLFGMKLAWWDANVDFTVPFTITDHVAQDNIYGMRRTVLPSADNRKHRDAHKTQKAISLNE